MANHKETEPPHAPEAAERPKAKKDAAHEDEEPKKTIPLDDADINILKSYGLSPYAFAIKRLDTDIKSLTEKITKLCGVRESDTGLCQPSQWDLAADKQLMQEQPLQVARCTKIIYPGGQTRGGENGENGESGGAGTTAPPPFGGDDEEPKYIINVKQIAKFVVGLGEKVAAMDIEEGMRVGVDRNKYKIQIPLPPKIDPTVTMMTVEEKPDVTYNDVGGAKEQLEKLREVLELPLLHPERFLSLGIDPPKGVLLYGPPGTGKTLTARAVANRTDACFICVIGSELVQK
nr:putative 26S proteasome regulatory subunit 7 [Toxoplasma gondii TgCATBr9]